jgi:hypothetical protein
MASGSRGRFQFYGNRAAISTWFGGSVENSGSELVDARCAATLVVALSFDLLQAIKDGLPAALRRSAPEIAPARLDRITESIFFEVRERYRVNASATLIALDALLRSSS